MSALKHLDEEATGVYFMFIVMICYYANTPNPDKSKLKWWLWKD